MPPKYAIQWGSVWHKSRLKSRAFIRKYGIQNLCITDVMRPPPPPRFIRERKKHININKFAGLSWTGWVPKFCLRVFFGSFLMGEKKHINKITPKIPGQSRENSVYVFFCLCVFFCSPFMPYEPFLLGTGVVLNLLRFCKQLCRICNSVKGSGACNEPPDFIY